MDSLLITNISQNTFVFTKYHSEYCSTIETCRCKTEDILRTVEGGLQYFTVRTPESVYLEPGESRDFDLAINKIPQVEEARKRGILQVKQISNDATSDPSGRT